MIVKQREREDVFKLCLWHSIEPFKKVHFRVSSDVGKRDRQFAKRVKGDLGLVYLFWERRLRSISTLTLFSMLKVGRTVLKAPGYFGFSRLSDSLSRCYRHHHHPLMQSLEEITEITKDVFLWERCLSAISLSVSTFEIRFLRHKGKSSL